VDTGRCLKRKKKKMKSINLTIATLLCALICAKAQAVPTYALTDVGFLPGFTDMDAYAINIHQDVVGAAYNRDSGVRHGFLYRSGKLIDLGALVGATNDSYAVAINAEGEVIGEFTDASGTHGFIYWDGGVQTVDILNGPTYLRAINDIGQIVGDYNSASSLTGYAFLRQPNGTIVQLPNFEGGIFGAEAINNLGQIAGTVWLANPAFGTGDDELYYVNHAVLMQAGGLAPRDLGTLGGPALATALNILGQVVGYSLEMYNGNLDLHPEHAALYAGGRVTNLGLPAGEVSVKPLFDSYALAINDLGQIVGFSDLTSSGEDPHGLTYLNGKMYDLNTLLDPATSASLMITEAVGINDLGQIVAGASDSAGTEHTVILTVEGAESAILP
jgi:probable HAF family extracellular repeat protein